MAAFAPEVITHLGPLPVTNTLIHTLLVDAVLISAAIYLSKHIKTRPQGLQTIIEPIIDGMYSLTESIASSKKAAKAIFPWVMTFFLFIFISNFTALLPGVGTFGFFPKEETKEHGVIQASVHAAEETHKESAADDHAKPQETGNQHADGKATDPDSIGAEGHEATMTPVLRGATSDINVTLALATISVIATHVLSIKLTGIKDHISRYFSFNPVNLYVGILELVAELTKIISLSFRLFGNIFAGEVALHTISAMFAFLAPLPFLLLESIVSVVQALVFSILTLVFMAVLTTPHHHAEAHEAEHH